MANIDLSKYGITGTSEIIYNPSYEQLFKDEMDPSLEGFDKGVLTELGAVNVMTGIYTGRSPKDKYIVVDENSKDTVWWTTEGYKNDNHPMTQETWEVVRDLAKNQLCNKKLYVVDAFCGANKDTRMAIRFIMEVAWQAHFVRNMFIKPTEEELASFEPDFVVYTASKAKCENYKELGLNSETVVAFNVTSREQVIINTWYGGEMKKGMFSMMNYYLPLKGIAAMHCSANTDMNGENTAIFFGLSGTGKTTLSTDPKRLLIGDDEHGWDDNGVFNFEGGCYAKVINLDKDSEPDIYNAIRRDALLENVTVDAEGKIDFADKSVTENTRVSYPIEHIEKIVKNVRPISAGPDAKNVIFLSADAFGVLPPVSILTPEQTKYYFLSGFTAKLAGTERGITEPTPTFSACFGQAFLELHPTKYAEELVKKMEKSGAKAYLVNTGWKTEPASAFPSRTPAASSTPFWTAISWAPPPRRFLTSTLKFPPSSRALIPAFLIRATPMPIPPSGMPRRRTSPAASSRTSSSTRATKPARLWFPPVHSSDQLVRTSGGSVPRFL